MTFYFALITGAACFAAAGYWAGRWHERDLRERAHGGYITFKMSAAEREVLEASEKTFADYLDRTYGGQR